MYPYIKRTGIPDWHGIFQAGSILQTDFGILPLFDDVVGATFDGRRDKKSEILEEVMHRWSHIPKSEMCLIGDTMFDVNGAKELGIFCIAVSYGFGDVEEMKAAGIAGLCDSIEQLPELQRL